MSEADRAAELLFATLPDGEYAIVEIMGHRTLVGRVQEVERFGATLMSIEPIFRGELLSAVLLGGASIYQFTPCRREVAAERGAKREYDLPLSIRAALPPEALPAPEFAPAFLDESAVPEPCAGCGSPDGLCDCLPF